MNWLHFGRYVSLDFLRATNIQTILLLNESKHTLSNPDLPQQWLENVKSSVQTKYLRCPIIGFMSRLTYQNVSNVVSEHGSPIDVKLFLFLKFGSYFSAKDCLRNCSKSVVVYSDLC